MEKYIIKKIYEKAVSENRYIKIYTNIPVGRGINGIDYINLDLNPPKPIEKNSNYVKITNIIFESDYLEIIVEDSNFRRATNYITYDSVTQITVFEDKYYNYQLRGIK